MPTVLQFRRGTTAQNNSFTGAAGEISVDTTVDSLRVHDGATAGGFEVNSKQSQYADVAERYHADSDEYGPGDLLVFGGENEVTLSSSSTDVRIAGVITTDPYCVMNSPHRQPDLTNEWHPAIALLGRVPAKVVGKVVQGDLMIASNVPGHAMSWKGEGSPPAGSVVGKALQSKDTDEAGEIEIVCGRL
jgi:hypothetical protein